MYAIETRPNTLVAAIALTFWTLTLTGCLARPFDGQKVRTQSTPILFEGYVPKPTTEVRVLAWNYGSRRY
jgi:hypothetical protein